MPYWQLRLEQLEDFPLAILHRIMLTVLPAFAASLLRESVHGTKTKQQCLNDSSNAGVEECNPPSADQSR